MAELLHYQGYQRALMLKYLHRLCIQRHRDALLEPACVACGDAGRDTSAEVASDDAADVDADDGLGVQVAAWCALIVDGLELRIRQHTGVPADCLREGDAMVLFHAEAAMSKALARILDRVCEAFLAGRDRDCDALLWQVLSQHFKLVMDQMDGDGAHRLTARRRIDRMRKTQEKKRGIPFASTAEAAAALCAVVVAEGIANLPVKPAKMEEYLLELEADSMRVDEQDIDRDASILDALGTPELMIALQQCVERLPAALQQALAIKLQWDGEPVFLRTEHMQAHYGFGWETVRKRARAAEQQLRECLEI